ncbi:MAG: nucleoside kinase [Bacteroidales bacterium]|nr:nucleoside kinase [Bacteroidales bacterium]
MIQVHCKNTGSTKEFSEGVYLFEILEEFKSQFKHPYQIVSAKVNNVSQGLRYKAYNSNTVEFLDVRQKSGMRVYFRSLCFLLCKATHDVIPGGRIYLEHPISNGYYCNIKKKSHKKLTDDDVSGIRARMRQIVEEDLQFHRYDAPTEDVIKLFAKHGYDDKVKLLETTEEVYTEYYTLGDFADYYYGRLVPSAGYLKIWELEKYGEGMLLRLPDRHHPDHVIKKVDQPHTFEVFRENLRWNIIMGLSNVGDVNHACRTGHASELIQVAEALQEKKIVQIAEEIARRARHRADPCRVVLITGPSSSGKTTFCQRLSVQLKACGLHPISFSTDDYFVNRADTPLLPDGKYDFDNFETVDHAYLESDVKKLLSGETVEVPSYNFVTGLREFNGRKLRLGRGSLLLVEGIHALNPALLPTVDDRCKYRVFINTLTSTSLDNHNSIPTSDNRLLRRIVRDYNKGAFTAVQTISQWPSVCDAEDKWILPFQEQADVMFNSAYLLEFAVLRNHAEQILRTVPKNLPEYSEAHRLLKFIRYFTPVSDKDIPSTSLLREFVGGSSFA